MAFVYQLNIQDNGSATFKKVENTAYAAFTKIDSKISITQKNMLALDNSTNIVNKSLGFLKTAGAGVVSILGANLLGALKDSAKAMVDNYDSATKLSANIGVATDSILGLRHAAELSHVGAEQMDKNMVKLSKTMFEAANGNKAASEAFKRLGVTLANNDGSLRKSDEVLMDMAEKFKALPPGAERASAALGIFGKSGAPMVSMLKDGKEGLQAMVNEGKNFAGNADRHL